MKAMLPERRTLIGHATLAFLLTLAVLGTRPGFAQFSTIAAPLPGVVKGSADWGDYDNDGDLDILLTGESASGPVSRVYRYVGLPFYYLDIGAGLEGVQGGDFVGHSSAVWGDYDADGDLDILLAGWTGSDHILRVYRNDGGTFTDIVAGLEGVSIASVAWGDYDNDGDLDILLNGSRYQSQFHITRVYRNDGGNFTNIEAGLPSAWCGSVAWGDYDNDGDLDILLTGGTLPAVSLVYRNDGGVFTDIGAGLEGVAYGSVAWGDYDNDGDLDILMAGDGDLIDISRVYRNDAGTFTDIAAGLEGVHYCSVAWGDYDNDGDLDILLAGRVQAGTSAISRVYRNDGGTFTDIVAGLEGVEFCSVAWGDYDDDGDLDIILSGYKWGVGGITRVYRNLSGTANTVPSSPFQLQHGVVVFGESTAQVKLQWQPATDVQTPSAGLTYNIRLGTTPGGSEVFSVMADLSTGYRRVARLGNTNHNRNWTVTLPAEDTTYYWSVQAVDGAFAGSAFAAEQSIEMWSGFHDIEAGLEGVRYSSVAWGDYDNDGDLDILMAGSTNSTAICRVCRNDGGSFSDIAAGLPGVRDCSLAWGDYDNDGDLDILLTGFSGGTRISRVYSNNGGTFTDIVAGLPGVAYSSVAWGDYDNDGDLDILLTGELPGTTAVSRVYRNDDGTFADAGAGLQPVDRSSASWGDYDNDGDLDILLTGEGSAGGGTSRVYNNDGGAFTDIGAGLAGMSSSSAAWGDYDNDGDLDILLAGSGLSLVYRNDGGSFTDIGAGLEGMLGTSAAWGDYDNDGDLDILLTGDLGIGIGASRVYRNDGGTFKRIEDGLAETYGGAAAWGDYDDDGDLDVLLTGRTGSVYVSNIYANQHSVANTAPMAPGGLAATWDPSGPSATFTWAPANDGETPAAGLGYNLRIGTTPGGPEIVSPLADVGTGYRRVVQLGSVNENTSWTVTLPEQGTYYWSVQAVDAAFTGSSFAPEETLIARFFVNLQWPATLAVSPGTISPNVYGQVYLPGLTDSPGQGQGITAQLGYGETGTDPTSDPSWQWTDAVYHLDVGDNDEYVATITVTAGGTYDYCYRYSFYGGDYVYGDLDGSDNDYSPDQAGSLVVTSEPGWWNLQWPQSTAAAPGGETSTIYGRIWLDGVTNLPGAGGGLSVQLGYGSQGTDPSTDPSWQWVDAVYNLDVGNNDEYKASLTASATGTYDYCYRYEVSGGPWVYGDLDGSDNGYSPDQAGSLVVTPVPGWWNLQWPRSIALPTGYQTPEIFGQVWLDGITNLPGAGSGLSVQIGYGSDGSDPSADPSWLWFDATYHLDVGDNDEYVATLTVDAEGSYDYCYRYAVSGGPWVFGDLDGSSNDYSPDQAGTLLIGNTAVEPPPAPQSYALHANAPNPFNPSTVIQYDVPGVGGHISLRIYDVSGQLVATLVDDQQGPGEKMVLWRGRDDQGREVASGTYFCQLRAAGFEETRKMTLLR